VTGTRSEGGAGPWLAFAGCSAIWGSTFLFISIGNDAVPPVWAATLRLALAALLLNLYRAARRQPWPTGPALGAAVSYGLFNFGINMPLLYWGELRVPSGLSAVFYAVIPLTTALFTRVLGMERLDGWRVTGAVVGFGGVALIFSSGFRADVAWLPMIAVLFSAICASLGGTLLRRGPRQSPSGANAVAATVGAPCALLMSFAFGEAHALPRGPAAIYPILYLTLAGSLGAFVLYAWLLNHWPATRTSFISVVVPVLALALGALVRHERISGTSLIGSAVVLTGVVIGLRPRPGAAAAH
jgi:drug/metabolite transporter (DMT)-like permease